MIAGIKRNFLSKWPIHVHSWGGLGSQLFACIVARRIISRFPGRRVVLMLHSSGVTYRGVELNSKISSSLNVKFRDDYKANVESDKTLGKKCQIFSLRNAVLKLLVRIGVIARLNDEADFNSISPFLTEVRGHYTRINLDIEEIHWILNSLDLLDFCDISPSNPYTAMHLRLGDLLTLKSKSHIDLDRLMQSKKFFSDSRKLLIYSDSKSEEVLQVIENRFNEVDVEVLHLETLKVIASCLHAEVFVGTNSKISLWIAILRLTVGSGSSTVMPRDLAKQVRSLLSSVECSKYLFEY